MAGVHIFEVGPRDGLQGLEHVVNTADKIELVALLREAGLKQIEVTSFVHPKRVPNMADAEAVYTGVCMDSSNSVGLSVLIPNKRGIDRAKAVGATNFNIFFSPNDDFNRENYGLSLKNILKGYVEALEGIDPKLVRVYISMAFGGCMDELSSAVKSGLTFGDKIVLCDTEGDATPFDIALGIDVVYDLTRNIGLHLHRGKHLMANVETAYLHGVREFDSSIGGLGGCPFMPKSGANLATEELVAWCVKMNIPCGVEEDALKPAIALAHRIKNPDLRTTLRNKVRETKGKILRVVKR
jgi:hydroxymethylglutaryl-CoA lyase